MRRSYSLYDDCIYDEAFRRRRRTEANNDVTPWRGGLNDYACPGAAMNMSPTCSPSEHGRNLVPGYVTERR